MFVKFRDKPRRFQQYVNKFYDDDFQLKSNGIIEI